MKVYFSKNFKKSYNKRIEPNVNLRIKFEARYDLFVEDPSGESLRDHALTGKLLGYRSFSISGDIRVIYYIVEDTVIFVDIGTHNQVYGK